MLTILRVIASDTVLPVAGLQLHEWVWFCTAASLGLSGLALLLWALMWDRSRGRLRCPKCWYRLEATAQIERDGGMLRKCPECGREANEHKLQKCRRRWGWATMAVLVLVLGGAAGGWPVVQSRGWSLISTRWLVELVPIGGYDGALGQELMKRLGLPASGAWLVPSASTDDIAFVATRLGEGNMLARPLSDRWRSSFGHIILSTRERIFSRRGVWGRFQHNSNTEPVFEAARTWYDLPVDLKFRTRSRWPEGYPLWVQLDARDYWPYGSTLHLDVLSPHLPARNHLPAWALDIGKDFGFTVIATPCGRGSLPIDAKLTQYQVDSGDGQDPIRPLDTRSFSVPYEIGGSIDEMLIPVVSPALDGLMSNVRYSVDDWWTNQPFESVRGGPAEGIGFGLVVEFYLGDELMFKERVWWDGSSPRYEWEDKVSFEWIPTADVSTRINRPTARIYKYAGWRMKIRSDPETALRVFDCIKYWEGELEIRLLAPDMH